MGKCSNLNSIDCLHTDRQMGNPQHLRRHTYPVMAKEVVEAVAKEMVLVLVEMESENHQKDKTATMCRWCPLGRLEVPLHHHMRKRKHVGMIGA